MKHFFTTLTLCFCLLPLAAAQDPVITLSNGQVFKAPIADPAPNDLSDQKLAAEYAEQINSSVLTRFILGDSDHTKGFYHSILNTLRELRSGSSYIDVDYSIYDEARLLVRNSHFRTYISKLALQIMRTIAPSMNSMMALDLYRDLLRDYNTLSQMQDHTYTIVNDQIYCDGELWDDEDEFTSAFWVRRIVTDGIPSDEMLNFIDEAMGILGEDIIDTEIVTDDCVSINNELVFCPNRGFNMAIFANDSVELGVEKIQYLEDPSGTYYSLSVTRTNYDSNTPLTYRILYSAQGHKLISEHPELDEQIYFHLLMVDLLSSSQLEEEGEDEYSYVEIEEEEEDYAEDDEEDDEGEVLLIADDMPQFPGGMTACYDFIRATLQYPDEARARGIAGRVLCSFVVNADGSISNIEILKSIDPALDAEAVRIILAMPRWTPGRNGGVPVRVRYALPILFKLQ